ncbi:MAG: SDR family oxidoreductase [Alphaproteobacteria bacterium]|nr:SDR family oxidoreductase [Alphaproteobacteria bacterium]
MLAAMRDLTDTTAVLTGAAGGIGQALARRLADQGCHLALADVDADRLAAVAATLHAPGRRVTTHVVDVTRPEALDAFADDVREAHGGCHLLLNNAGVTVHGPFAVHTADDLDWLLDVNVRGVIHGCRAFRPMLQEAGAGRGAHVVNTASMAGLFGCPTQASYSASKWALRGFTAALRVEWAPLGIGVTALLPGTIATGFLAAARTHDAGASAWMATQMQRYGTAPDRVAARAVTGIRRNRAEVLAGWDAHAIAWTQWVAPWLLPTVLRLGYAWAPPPGAAGPEGGDAG